MMMKLQQGLRTLGENHHQLLHQLKPPPRHIRPQTAHNENKKWIGF